jgi:hypothetical protein
LYSSVGLAASAAAASSVAFALFPSRWYARASSTVEAFRSAASVDRVRACVKSAMAAVRCAPHSTTGPLATAGSPTYVSPANSCAAPRRNVSCARSLADTSGSVGNTLSSPNDAM